MLCPCGEGAQAEWEVGRWVASRLTGVQEGGKCWNSRLGAEREEARKELTASGEADRRIRDGAERGCSCH